MRTFLLFLIALVGARAQTPIIQGAPSWSPDGTSVCYVSDQTGNAEIYILHMDTGKILKITDTPTEEWTPAWSPDGTKIAYVSNKDGDKELYYYDLVTKTNVRVTNTLGDEVMPSWTQDSKTLVFIYSLPNSANKILTTTLDGTKKDLTPNLNNTYIYPSISPNGKYLLYCSKPTGGEHQFHVTSLELSTGNEIQLEEMGFVSYNPTWSCRGNEIVFINQQEKEIKSASIYRMATDGSSVEKLIVCDGGCFQPRVAEDCNKLVYRNGWKEDHKGIYVFDLKSKKNIKLITDD